MGADRDDAGLLAALDRPGCGLWAQLGDLIQTHAPAVWRFQQKAVELFQSHGRSPDDDVGVFPATAELPRLSSREQLLQLRGDGIYL